MLKFVRQLSINIGLLVYLRRGACVLTSNLVAELDIYAQLASSWQYTATDVEWSEFKDAYRVQRIALTVGANKVDLCG